MTEVTLFYEKAAGRLGSDFLDDIQVAIDSIRNHPELGASAPHGFRRVLLRRFPFSIIHVVESAMIVVVAVAHQRRAPQYCRNRT